MSELVFECVSSWPLQPRACFQTHYSDSLEPLSGCFYHYWTLAELSNSLNSLSLFFQLIFVLFFKPAQLRFQLLLILS